MGKLRILLFASVFLLSVVAGCWAQTQFPDTPAARQCAAWLATFNGDTRDNYRDFLQKNFPSRLQGLEQDLSFRDMSGGFELKKVEESTPTKLVALVQERVSDQFARLTLEVEAAEPYRITRLELRAIPRPPEFALPHMTESELTKGLRTRMEQDAAADRFAGAALLARKGKPVFEEALGLADREHKTPDTLKTRFRIGSMNKMFTATATLQLVQAGKLGLDDPLGKFLTDYPNKDTATKARSSSC
jgi:D-alanyl-D-alanine carboxypeptidase